MPKRVTYVYDGRIITRNTLYVEKSLLFHGGVLDMSFAARKA